MSVEAPPSVSTRLARNRLSTWAYVAMIVVALSTMAAYFIHRAVSSQKSTNQRILTAITFAKGLQVGPTWSPDGRFVAYASNHAGKFDIWVQQLSGGDPVQVTHQPGDNWQPDWSPDGKLLVYRSEQGDGGLFVVPAMGGQGQERRISSSATFRSGLRRVANSVSNNPVHFHKQLLRRGARRPPPQAVLTDFSAKHRLDAMSAAWHPDGKRISVSVWNGTPIPEFWTAVGEGAQRQSKPIWIQPQPRT